MRLSIRGTSAALLLGALASCSPSQATAPAPVPSATASPPPSGVRVGSSSGPTTIAYLSAAPEPGATLSGCGDHGEGCAGRIRIAFRLTPTRTGSVLFVVGFLHAADKTACLEGRLGGFELRAGEPRTVEVAFGPVGDAGRCRTALDLTDLALVVEGTVEVASRQEWSLRYRLDP